MKNEETMIGKIAYEVSIEINEQIEGYIEKVVNSELSIGYLVNRKKIIDAVLKQTPKQPALYGGYFGDYGTYIPTDWECPSCGAIYDYEDERYGSCPNCGKKIDWSDENEND